MAQHRIDLVMNGITGRMDMNQRPILAGRNAGKIRALAA